MRTTRFYEGKDCQFNIEMLEPRVLLSGTHYVVDSLLDVVADDGMVTLREAIQAANTNTPATSDVLAGSDTEQDIITFGPSLAGGVILLNATQLTISDDLAIEGLGLNQLSVDAAGLSRVLIIQGAETDVQLSSITITGGFTTDDDGGGILMSGKSLTISNVAISGNATEYVAGPGMANGGGIYIDSGDVSIEDSTISENNGRYRGGGIYNNAGTLTLFGSSISGNTANIGDGAGIYNDTGAMILTGTSVTGNKTETSGRSGSGIYNNAGNATLTDVSITFNETYWGRSGGGVYNRTGAMEFANSIISDNGYTGEGGGIYNYSGTIKLTSSDVSRNWAAGNGGGIYNYYGQLTLIDIQVLNNHTTDHGGGIFNKSGSVVIINSELSHNLAYRKSAGPTSQYGGGIYNGTDGDAALINVTLLNNRARQYGGGIYNAGTMTVANAVIACNTVYYNGGGIYNVRESNMLLNNSTVAGNICSYGDYQGANDGGSGGGISYYSNTLVMNNSIVALNRAWKNPDSFRPSGQNNIIGGNPQFIRQPDDNANGWYDNTSTGGIDESLDNDFGDLRLLTTSGALDKGDASLLPADEFDLDGDGDVTEQIPFDRDGNARIAQVGETVLDIGAYENPLDVIGDISIRVDGGSEDIHLYDFATVEPGEIKTVTLTVHNEGNGSLTVSRRGVLPNLFTITPDNYSNGDQWVIPAEETLDFTVTFDPRGGGGYYQERMILDSDDPYERMYIIEFTGGQTRGAVNYVVDSLLDVSADDGITTLREAIEASNKNVAYNGLPGGSALEADTITFDPSLAGGTIRLEQGYIQISDSLNVIGLGADQLTIDAMGYSRVFRNRVDGKWAWDHGAVISGMTLTGTSGGSAVDNLSRTTLNDLVITGNQATNGGGVYTRGVLEMNNCIISNNSAEEYGGGIYNRSPDETIINNSIISGNHAKYGGAISMDNQRLVTINNTTISGNTADDRGGGIYNIKSPLSLTDVTLADNTSPEDGGGIYSNQADVIVTSSTISNNESGGHGGGLYCVFGAIAIIDSYVSGNVAQKSAGGVFANSDVVVSDSVFSQNIAQQYRGGGLLFNGANGTVFNTIFTGNYAGSDGGGFATESARVLMNNVIAAGNQAAGRGGGMYLHASRYYTDINNTTVTANWSGNGGGVGASNIITMNNTIVALNLADENSEIQCEYTGEHNLVGVDPMFIRNPSPGDDGLWGTADDDYGNLRLMSNSPAIDSGYYDENIPSSDMLGRSRYDDPAVINSGSGDINYVDIGAYEAQYPMPQINADFNGDQSVGMIDLDILGQNWGIQSDATKSMGDANGDGKVSLLDLDILGQTWGSGAMMSDGSTTNTDSTAFWFTATNRNSNQPILFSTPRQLVDTLEEEPITLF